MHFFLNLALISSKLMFKYYVSKLGGGWGVKACADTADAGGGGGSKIWEKLLT